MLNRILSRKDVCTLIKDIYNKALYLDKNGSISVKYECKYQVLFILFDALYKYSVIVEEEKYLDNYIFQIDKVFRKFNDVVDINSAINNLVLNACVLKLGIDNRESHNNKVRILSYIYDRYIVNGYLFHGFSGIYKKDIMNNGFAPERYHNIYTDFIEVDKIFRNHDVENIMGKNFGVYNSFFTDSFTMACFYGANSPMYFYHLLCDNILLDDEANKTAYFNNDYHGCFDNLNKTMRKVKLNSTEKKKIMRVCLDEWKLLEKSEANINILLVKRKLFGINKIDSIDDLLNSDRDFDLVDNVFKILCSSNDKVMTNQNILRNDIEFIEIPNYKVLFDLEKLKLIEDKKDNDNLDTYGKVSILILLGSILITLGVILTIIMISGGI